MLLNVVEAEGEDLEDNLIENLYPIFVLIFFHKSKIVNEFDAGFLVCGLLGEETSGDSLFVSTG